MPSNEYFCEVDEDFILDRFNLTGLNNEVANYAQALDLITDNLDEDIQDDLRGSLDVQARLLYGLIHARWIVTQRGLSKMLDKYKRADFGRCPRVLCQSQPLLPVGLTDVPYEKSVKLYCGRCEDLYSPKSTRHGSIDGAYFGTTFPHLLFLVYPALIAPKSGPVDVGGALAAAAAAAVASTAGAGGAAQSQEARRNARSRRTTADDGQDPSAGTNGAPGSSKVANSSTAVATAAGESSGLGVVSGAEGLSTAAVALKSERYRPRIYGFQLNEIAKLQRWQEAMRDKQIARLEELEERES